MEITIGFLEKVIEELKVSVPDYKNIVLADLQYGNTKFHPFQNAKRLLLLKGGNGWKNKTYLTHNGMGSHFDRKGEQSDLKFIGYFNDKEMVFVK